jgi:2-polyprenyl-3-methyl-5-hydroxy-6-metoxy-1,4-benzoquinol methylase
MRRSIAASLLAVPLCYAQGDGVEAMAARFNKMYANPNPVFRTEPSTFLVKAAEGLKPGKALDAAMGQGRNSVYLAQKGWDVTGYDVSEEGLSVARINAGKAGVKINAVLKSHSDFDFGKDQWDLVVMTFSLASMEDKVFLRRVVDSVKPGGMLLVEQFNSAPGPGSKGPANALFKTFEGMRVLYYEDVEDVSDWGKMRARIGRIVAQKE